MKTKQIIINNADDPKLQNKDFVELNPQLVFVFGSVQILSNPHLARNLQKNLNPETIAIGCSTAGEISNLGISDEKAVITGVNFQKPDFKFAKAELLSMTDSSKAGRILGEALKAPNLTGVMVFGLGVNINGSELVSSLQNIVGQEIKITGGLAGDGGKFEKTYTYLNGEQSSSQVVALGIYGQKIKMYFGSMGGWEAFGPARKVTKSEGNILLELDGKPALPLYKEYLGKHAKDLPASGLLFPLSLLKSDLDTSGLIRTILAIDEKNSSLTFAGDIPLGATVRLMHAPEENLILGAKIAAEATKANQKNGLALLISCVGRKLVLGDATEDEIDAVKNVFGPNTTYTGFYSYGEICPLYSVANCKLHNQTMTITYLHEEN